MVHACAAFPKRYKSSLNFDILKNIYTNYVHLLTAHVDLFPELFAEYGWACATDQPRQRSASHGRSASIGPTTSIPTDDLRSLQQHAAMLKSPVNFQRSGAPTSSPAVNLQNLRHQQLSNSNCRSGCDNNRNQNSAPRRPHSAPLPGALVFALSQSTESRGERKEIKSKQDVLRSFYDHQMEVCQHFDAYGQQFNQCFFQDGIISADEYCEMLQPIRTLALMHHDLLEQLQRDSDRSARSIAKPKFWSLVHDTFFEMREPFKAYMGKFDCMFQNLSYWKATNPAFCQVVQAREGASKLNFASYLALPLMCLQIHQEITQQYRLTLHQDENQDEDNIEIAYVDETLSLIRSMRQRANVHGASDQAVKALLRIEKKMVHLAAAQVTGAAVSIVRLGRQLVHIGHLRMLGGPGGAGGNEEEQHHEYTGYLFSDMLVCCDGHRGGMVAHYLVDLKTAEIESYTDWTPQRNSLKASKSCQSDELHAFGIYQTDPRDQPPEKPNRLKMCKDFGTDDAGSRDVWVTKLRQCLALLAAEGLRLPPLGNDEIGRLRRVSKELIRELGLFAGSVSDTTEDSGRHGTSASDSEWDVEGAVYDDTLYEEEESGLMAGLRKGRESARLKGLTADSPEFNRVFMQKLQLFSLQQRSGCTTLIQTRSGWKNTTRDDDDSDDWDPSASSGDDEGEEDSLVNTIGYRASSTIGYRV